MHTSAVKEDENRLVQLGRCFGPNIQSQTVLALSVIVLTSRVGHDPELLRSCVGIVDWFGRGEGTVTAA